MGRLEEERSPYLRHAAGQRVDWYPWSDDAFERARREDKPVFLSSGGVWCHWCHVMAKESFGDEEVARILNEHFISVKIDRDERPDIDHRYQQAVAAMGGGSGWPLSVFLTPERKAFFGGTYFPPEDMEGRPGFKNVLRSVSRFYREQRREALEHAGRIMETLSIRTAEGGELLPSSLDAAKDAVLARFDPQNGGFGQAPKFPIPGALEFLLHRSAASGDHSLDRAVRTTLDAMAGGGFHDHLGGGFHRYSTDASWTIPHFEKMADDNAWLLRNYAHAWAVFVDPFYREVAEGIIRFVREVLSDPSGGFFASQDADVTPDNEGGYFTWTVEELQEALSIDEYEVISRHLLHPRSAMHHDTRRKVLCAAKTPEEVARDLVRPREEIAGIIRTGKEKLLALRLRREAPFVDRTLYTSLNGMLITSFLRAFRVFGDPSVRDFALAGIDRVLRERFSGGILYHAEGVRAVLEDHVFLVEALVEAYETTGGKRYLELAEQFASACLERFEDDSGGLFDTEAEVLGARLKRIDDVPHPSANAVAAMTLLKLHHITGNAAYLASAEKILTVFSGTAAEYGIHAGAYFSALDAWFNMFRLHVEADPGSDLAGAARSAAGPYTVLIYGKDLGRVVPCFRHSCFKPVRSPAELEQALRERAA